MSSINGLQLWLRTQLDDDEQVAREAVGFYDDRDLSAELVEDGYDREVGDLAARWDPARVLAEVKAKRRVLDWLLEVERFMDSDDLARWQLAGEADTDQALLALAQPYAGRPGWREEWRT